MNATARVLLLLVVLALLAGAGYRFLGGAGEDDDRAVAPSPTSGVTSGATPAGVVVTKDIAYAPAEPDGDGGHLLDLYLPEGHAEGKPLPLVLWSMGSAWREEDGREGADAVAAALVPRGYAVAGVAVRSSGVAKFPAQLWDYKAAVRYLRANASRYGLDPDRFAASGESSGGWGAAMVGLTSGVTRLEGAVGTTGVSSAVRAVVPFYPPADFATMDDQALKWVCPPGSDASNLNCHGIAGSPEADLLGCVVDECPELVAEASPVRFAQEAQDPPPFLILHGEQDPSVPYGQSRELFGALADGCHPATLISVPKGVHSQWLEFLTDRELTADATVETVRGCDVVKSDGLPSWDYVADFLAAALK